MEIIMNNISNAIAAFIVAILSGLGVGSGGLLMIWLTGISGYSPVEARSINLLFFLFCAGSALLIHIKQRKMNFRFIITSALFGIMGTLIGTWLGMAVSPEIIKKVFGGMLILSGLYSLFGTKLIKKQSKGQNMLNYGK